MTIGEPCAVCPATADQVCPYSLWRSGCPAPKAPEGKRRDWHIAAARRQLEHKGPPSDVDLKVIVKVESCPHRWSSCGCTAKPAVCSREALPMPTSLPICKECVGSA